MKADIFIRWALRNCGVMLLKALLYRLSGGTSSNRYRSIESHKRLAKKTYSNYPQLANLVEDLLHRSSSWRSDETLEDQTSRQVHNAFPAMEIIDRIGVADERCDVVSSLLRQQLNSPIWILRDKAARTLGYLVSEDELILQIKQDVAVLRVSQNQLHGRFLCLKYRLEDSFRIDPCELQYILVCEIMSNFPADLTLNHFDDLVGLFNFLVLDNPCPYTACTYLEFMTLLLRAMQMNHGDIDSAVKRKSIEYRKRTSIDAERLSACLEERQGILDQDLPIYMQMKRRDKQGHSNLKQALARFKASSEYLVSTIALRSMPAASESESSVSLDHEHGSPYLEALQAHGTSIGIRHQLLALRVYLNGPRAETDEEQALGNLANLLSTVPSTIREDFGHNHNLKQDFFAAGMEVLASPSFMSPRSPTAAQFALHASGGIFSLLYYCGDGEPGADFDQRVWRWAQSLRLWLDESCVSYSCTVLAFTLKIYNRNFPLDSPRSRPSNVLKKLWLDLGTVPKVSRRSYRFAAQFMTLLSMMIMRSGRRLLKSRLAC